MAKRKKSHSKKGCPRTMKAAGRKWKTYRGKARTWKSFLKRGCK